MNLMGALNLESMSFIYQDFEIINSGATIEFFKKLETAYPNACKIHWIGDNAGYFKSEEGAQLETSRLEGHYLPPRCPNLNPTGRLCTSMCPTIKFMENLRISKPRYLLSLIQLYLI